MNGGSPDIHGKREESLRNQNTLASSHYGKSGLPRQRSDQAEADDACRDSTRTQLRQRGILPAGWELSLRRQWDSGMQAKPEMPAANRCGTMAVAPVQVLPQGQILPERVPVQFVELTLPQGIAAAEAQNLQQKTKRSDSRLELTWSNCVGLCSEE